MEAYKTAIVQQLKRELHFLILCVLFVEIVNLQKSIIVIIFWHVLDYISASHLRS